MMDERDFYNLKGSHHNFNHVSLKFFNRLCKCTVCSGITSLDGDRQQELFINEFLHMSKMIAEADSKWDAKRVVTQLSFLAEFVQSTESFDAAYELLQKNVVTAGFHVMLPAIEALYSSRFVNHAVVDDVLLRKNKLEIAALAKNEFLPLEILMRLYGIGSMESALLLNPAFPFESKVEAKFLNKVQGVHTLTAFFDAILVDGFQKKFGGEAEEKLAEWCNEIAFGCSSPQLGLALTRSGQVAKRLSDEATALLFFSYGKEDIKYDVEE
jgi:hypothetical protein